MNQNIWVLWDHTKWSNTQVVRALEEDDDEREKGRKKIWRDRDETFPKSNEKIKQQPQTQTAIGPRSVENP